MIPDENGNYTGGAIREVLIDTTETKRGSFTFNCPDGLTKMRISGLEAGVTYVVKETESGELYQPVNDTIEVSMPIYGGSRTERIVNDYLLRSLAVTKTVTGAINEFEEKVEDVFDESGNWINTIYTQIDKRPAFTMTLKMYKDGSGVPETGEHRYMLLESGETESEVFLDTHDQGQFELKNGGAYTYELIYTNDAAGEVKVLYSSQNVGGEGSQDGLREATSAMGEYFYLGRLGAKGIGHIDLTIVLDPETIGNAYQNTLANLQMAFAVDTVSGGGGSGGNAEGGSGIGPASPVSAVFSLGGVQTGDADDFLLWSMAALVSGLVLMIWAIICFKRDKGGRRHA